MDQDRKSEVRRGLFRGAGLHLDNAEYLLAVRAFTGELSSSDLGSVDLTSQALGIDGDLGCGRVLAKACGVAAGLAEFSWLLSEGGLRVTERKRDGESIAPGDVLVEIEGKRSVLLEYERVGLNLLQRMSGIATASRSLQDRLFRRNSAALVVGTRKTPWGLLDKRALHLGGVGTHRLGLWDAILIKNNHLALLPGREEEAVCVAIRRAWASRGPAAFVEVEVRSRDSALAAARTFREVRKNRGREHNVRQNEEYQGPSQPPCPCILMLDNLAPAEVRGIVDALRSEELLEDVLIESSGNISDANFEAYADCGADAISIGALTHSVRALDLSLALA
jgi:nicotinate-nucleotide pyrophosphorylase (carboxylating)